jgi:hypothetical protein
MRKGTTMRGEFIENEKERKMKKGRPDFDKLGLAFFL